MDDKEVFDQFCQQVGLDEECGEKSWNVWESVSKKVSQTTKVHPQRVVPFKSHVEMEIKRYWIPNILSPC